MTNYTLKDVEVMQEKIRGLETTIEDFRAKGCSIPRCERCGELLEDLYEDEAGHIHLSCGNCGKVDYLDKKIQFKCGRRWFDQLAEAEGLDLEEDGK